MTAVVPVYRCGAAPDSHQVPSRRSGWPEHRRGINVSEVTGRVKSAESLERSRTGPLPPRRKAAIE